MKKEIPETEITLHLHNYNGIFSDFDPRPYAVRGISSDLLNELQRASHSKPSGEVELRLSVPRSLRNKEDEIIITRRLQDHFRKHYLEAIQSIKRIKQKGIAFITVGALISLLGAFVAFANEGEFFFYVLTTLLEPAGWFTIWNGFDLVIFGGDSVEPNLKFYERMSRAEIIFSDY